jgi:hypothetical protein
LRILHVSSPPFPSLSSLSLRRHLFLS